MARICAQAAAAFTGLVNVTIVSNDTASDGRSGDEVGGGSRGGLGRMEVNRREGGTTVDEAATTNALALGEALSPIGK